LGPLNIRYIYCYFDPFFENIDVLGIFFLYHTKTVTKQSNVLHEFIDPIISEFNVEITIFQCNLGTFLKFVFSAFFKTYVIGFGLTL
jgi:hypothetical protein